MKDQEKIRELRAQNFKLKADLSVMHGQLLSYKFQNPTILKFAADKYHGSVLVDMGKIMDEFFNG